MGSRLPAPWRIATSRPMRASSKPSGGFRICIPRPPFSSTPTTRSRASGTSSVFRKSSGAAFGSAVFASIRAIWAIWRGGSRAALDEAGLREVTIFASGGLDEHEIARLVKEAPSIDGFGVGTKMGVSEDAPALDMAYKATAYAGRGRLKLAAGKKILPGRKQIFRIEKKGEAVRDVLARHDESLPGRPLMRKVMEGGKRLPSHVDSLEAIRENAGRETALLPPRLRGLSPATPAYPVEVSDALQRYQERVASEVARP